MKTWTIVAVLGRPSINTRDFFNSISFWVYDVEALTKDKASLDCDPASQPDYKDRTKDDYQVLNWFTFPKEEEKIGTQKQG